MKRHVKRRFFLPLGAVILAAAALLAGFSAAASSGSQSDPLISRSYLENIFAPGIMAETETLIAQKESALTQRLTVQLEAYRTETGGTGQATYRVVTLSKDQTLTGGVGLEILPRAGSVVCVADSAPGLIDMTGGGTMAAGNVLAQNHLYMATAGDRGVQAVTDSATVLVKGGYTVR